MRAGAAGCAVLLAAAGAAFQAGADGWAVLLLLWLAMGVGYSAILTPSGRLLRRSAHQQDRPAVFAAQFALSHACWLATYPLAGWLGAEVTMPVAFFVLAALAACGAAAASLVWPADDPDVLWHDHDDLSPQHPHVQGAARTTKGWRHAHAFVIDEHHARWPAPG
jgi:hypothetical protein